LLWVFYFLKKGQTRLSFFLENKKNKILAKNLGFYACSVFFTGTHFVNPSFSAKGNPQQLLWVFFKKNLTILMIFEE
jgi:hypothetical protein